MNEEHFLAACQLRDEGKYAQAYEAFRVLGDETTDRVDKAGILLHAAKTLKLQEKYIAAEDQLRAARELVTDYLGPSPSSDERIAHLEIYLDYEDADLSWKQGKNKEALAKFESSLKRYEGRLREPDFAGFYELTQTCRAFILADLGRWKEAMPVLEEARSFPEPEYKEGITFYLGHCYLSAGEVEKAEELLAEALKLGLPESLEFRAHCELGMVYNKRRDYAKAKQEFEKCVATADSKYIQHSRIWEWLQDTCRALGLRAEAEDYARRAKPS